jgi:maltoporin
LFTASPAWAQPDEEPAPPTEEEVEERRGPEAADGAEEASTETGDGAEEPTAPASGESDSSEAADPGRSAAPERTEAGGAKDRSAGAEVDAGPTQGAAHDGGEAERESAADEHVGRFAFGTYGRVIAAADGTGRPGRETDIVAHGSRLDLQNYVELELRREDQWPSVDASTRMVATLALGHPIFHYDGDFEARLAVRNLYLEERDLGLEGLSLWMGSRMLRGDDIYLLDFWPLDNLNTVGGGVRYDICGSHDRPEPADEPAAEDPESSRPETQELPPPWCTGVQLHGGLGQPNNPFYQQQVSRASPLDQFGAATVAVLDRQRWVLSLKGEQILRFGGTEGIKLVAYGEVHSVPSAQRETAVAEVFEQVPSDDGFVVGAQAGGFLGDRGSFLNLFVRYAGGLAAYGEFGLPEGLSPERTADGAHEVLVALSGNLEAGPFALTLGSYFRSFRNANGQPDFGDVDEGIFIARPHLFFIDWAGVALEGSYQTQHRGVLVADMEESGALSASLDPLVAGIGRIGVIPFLAPGGPGAFSRPWFFFTYAASFRDEGARLLYPEGDVFRIREIDHYVGFGAEWWFGSSSYGGE